jgi:hypothetical protein
MSTIKSITEVVAGLRQPEQQGALVKNWHEYIPASSRWCPGSPGKPDCQSCGGTGYLRLDLPLGHPLFGKLFLCECVDGEAVKAPEPEKPAEPEPQEFAWQQETGASD